MSNSPTVVHAEPLRSDAFAPYGRVVEYGDDSRRLYVPEAFERIDGLTTPTLWLRSVRRKKELPLIITRLERHPYSAQTFLPTGNFSHLIVVCEASEDDAPDLATLKVFVATEGQGVSYRRNVWHHGFTLLDDSADFIVVMSLTENGDDDVFIDLQHPIEVRGCTTPHSGDAHV
jgi:ureidoglycolate lyase